MHIKLAAALTIAIFALSTVAILAPVAAHTTEGNLLPTFPFHVNDSDNNPSHVAGPTAYVWPGGGLNVWNGAFNGFPPGYQNPYGTYPTGAPSSNYQLQGNAYSPFGAILTSTDDHPNKGPLIIALNFTCVTFTGGKETRFCGDPDGVTPNWNFTGVGVYFSPEWDLSSPANNPGLITATGASMPYDGALIPLTANDPFMPNGWLLETPGDFHWWASHNYQEWYYIRINDVVAPKVAGKYVLKVFLTDGANFFVRGANIPGMWNTNSGEFAPGPGDTTVCPGHTGNPYDGNSCLIGFGPTAFTVPVANWPVIVVKGEIDPGIVTGTIRYGGFNQTLYSRPINLAGKVWMTGVANDPYTGTSTGRNVTARGYFNASAAGHFEVEGVAPGVYDVYASAAGYPTTLIASQITILPGQSFHLDGYLNPGAVIHGQVFSKHLFGEQPWPSNPRPISVYLYSSNQYGDENAVAWSPWNATHAPYMSYNWPQASNLPQPLAVSFPWDSGQAAGFAPGATPYALSYYSKDFSALTIQDDILDTPGYSCGTNGITTNPFTPSIFGRNAPFGTDPCSVPNGVGPAQYWWVDKQGRFTNGGGTNSFRYEFGVKGVYGAPTTMDGDVPQPLATWVNGLTAGRYWVRAWLNGYVQTLQDGVTLDEYYFDIAKDEWAGDVFMPSDLRVSSVINKTIHFHDQPGTLQECPISGCAGNSARGDSAGPRYLIAEVRDSSSKVLVGLNFTSVGAHDNRTTISINGLGMMGPDNGGSFFGDPTLSLPLFGGFSTGNRDGAKYSYYYYCALTGECADSPSGGHDYGLPSGTYTIYVYMRGYVQQTFESVSVTLSGSPALISNHLYRGGRFNVTLYSIDWEHPRVQRPWQFPGARIQIFFASDQPSLIRERVSEVLHQPAGDTTHLQGSVNCRVGSNPSDNTAFGQVDVCHIIEYDGFFAGDADGPDKTEGSGQVIPLENILFAKGFLRLPWLYRTGAGSNFRTVVAFESGTYRLWAATYGYVQYQAPSVYVPKGGFGDIRIQLLQGVNFTINIPFKTEGIYTPTTTNMTMRIRVFNDQGLLLATAATHGPDVVSGATFSDAGGAGNGGARDELISRYGTPHESYYVDPFGVINPEDGTVDPTQVSDTFLWYGTYNGGDGRDHWYAFDSTTYGGFSGAYNSFAQLNSALAEWKGFIPAGTKQVRVMIAGIYDDVGDPLNEAWYGALSTWKPEGFVDGRRNYYYYGIPGFSSTLTDSYTGSYSVEVDFWNLYPNATFTSSYATLPSTADTYLNPLGLADQRNWFPPVEGLLQGDSFHTIPGSAAGPFGYTGDSLAANGLGPYAQRGPWVIPNAHLGAEASAIFEVDKRGYIAGNVYGYNYANELRPESWATVSFAAATGNLTFSGYTWDSFYGQYLDPGQYTYSVFYYSPSGNQGYTTVSGSVNISAGQSVSGVQFQLERSNIPIPEFSGLAIVAISALAASVYLLRRRRQ